MFARLKAWRRRRPATTPPAEEIARLLLVEWLGRTDRTVLSDICTEHGRDACALAPIFSFYEFACVYLVFGPRVEGSQLVAEALGLFTGLVQSQMTDKHVVDQLGRNIQAAGKRLASLLEGTGRDKPVSWARESLGEDFGIDETNPVTLTLWAHYWMDYYVHLSKACEDMCRIYQQGDPSRAGE